MASALPRIPTPLGFIRSHSAPLVIDEAQLAPELFNVIQVESDRVGTPGQYILSGSQNFILKQQISQSLAGRVGMLDTAAAVL